MTDIPRIPSAGTWLTPRGAAPTQHDMPGDQHVALAKVGAGESELWARVEGRKAYVEVTLMSGAMNDCVVAECDCRYFGMLKPGSVVIVTMVNGDPNNCYISKLVDVVGDGIPDTICGVQTGAALADDVDAEVPPVAPMPLFTWMWTRDGRLFAVQTGAGGDILLHSGAAIELKASEVLVKAKMAVGFGFLTPPIGKFAGVEDVEGGELESFAGVPPLPNIIENLTQPPYVGDQDAVVRAKDVYQSNINVDPVAFGWIAKLGPKLIALDTLLAAICTLDPVAIAAQKIIYDAVPAPGPAPTVLNSNAVTASAAMRVGDNA